MMADGFILTLSSTLLLQALAARPWTSVELLRGRLTQADLKSKGRRNMRAQARAVILRLLLRISSLQRGSGMALK